MYVCLNMYTCILEKNAGTGKAAHPPLPTVQYIYIYVSGHKYHEA